MVPCVSQSFLLLYVKKQALTSDGLVLHVPSKQIILDLNPRVKWPHCYQDGTGSRPFSNQITP